MTTDRPTREPGAHEPPMIEAEGLSKSFGPVHAVRGVSFSVARGELVGFLGPNGAGKSTTMKMLTGSLLPDGGRAAIGGGTRREIPQASPQGIRCLHPCAGLVPRDDVSPSNS